MRPMLLQGSVGQLFAGRLTREHGYLAVTMKYYPRFLRRELRDEYIRALSPPFCLFEHYRQVKKETGDANETFKRVDYENRFWLEEEGFAHLERLAKRSHREDVYLICHCDIGGRCHRELLLLLAEHFYGAKIVKVHNSYPQFRRRLKRAVSIRDAGPEFWSDLSV